MMGYDLEGRENVDIFKRRARRKKKRIIRRRIRMKRATTTNKGCTHACMWIISFYLFRFYLPSPCSTAMKTNRCCEHSFFFNFVIHINGCRMEIDTSRNSATKSAEKCDCLFVSVHGARWRAKDKTIHPVYSDERIWRHSRNNMCDAKIVHSSRNVLSAMRRSTTGMI